MELKTSNEALYQKMQAELKEYGDWLVCQSPEEILQYASQYAAKEEILLALEYFDLEEPQAAALLKTGNPLEQVYCRFSGIGTNSQTQAAKALEAEANHRIRKNFLKQQDRGR